jgi:hypothetical protein
MIFRELRAAGLASAGAARRTTWRLQLRQNEFTKVKVIDRRPCISDRKNSIDKTCASATQRSGASRSGRKSSPQFISAIDAYAAQRKSELKSLPTIFSRFDAKCKITIDRRSTRKSEPGSREPDAKRRYAHFLGGRRWAQAGRKPRFVSARITEREGEFMRRRAKAETIQRHDLRGRWNHRFALWRSAWTLPKRASDFMSLRSAAG